MQEHWKGNARYVYTSSLRLNAVEGTRHDLSQMGISPRHPLTVSTRSGVVSLRSLHIVVFLAELNDQQLWGADIRNAYLEAKTKEKVYIIGGTGFGELEGHTLIIYKALYGLKSSGARWHEKLVDSFFERSDSSSPRQTVMYGCDVMVIYMNT